MRKQIVILIIGALMLLSSNSLFGQVFKRNVVPTFTQLNITVYPTADAAFFDTQFIDDITNVTISPFDIPEESCIYATSYEERNFKIHTFKTYIYEPETWTILTGYGDFYEITIVPLHHRNTNIPIFLDVYDDCIDWNFGGLEFTQEESSSGTFYIE